MAFRFHIAWLTTVLVGAAAAVNAQTINASWQLQPYCNRLTLALAPSPVGFMVDGTDDQCGAVNAGSVVGHASFSQNGSVALNVSIVTAPAGRPVHVSAIVSPATGTGTWTDSVGNTGTFAFLGAVPGLPPRPLPASALPPGSVGSTELAAGAVGTAQIAAGAVGATQLLGNAVTGAKVLDGSLTSVDLADGPRAASVDVTAPTLTTAAQVIATVTLTAPAAGRVLVNATTYTFIFASAGVAGFGQCSLSRGTTLDGLSLTTFGANPSGVTDSPYVPIALTRGFVVSAGSVSVNLVCYRNSTANLSLGPINMTALYVP